MSLKTTLNKIIQAISKFFKGLKPLSKKAVKIGVDITNAVKTWDSKNPGVLNFVTTLIPGDLDDRIVAEIRKRLPSVMIELRLVDAVLNETNGEQILIDAIAVIQQITGDYRIQTLNGIAAKLTALASDGDLDFDDALDLVRWYYKHEQNPAVDTSI